MSLHLNCALFFNILLINALCGGVHIRDHSHESGEDPELHKLKFNHDKLPAWITGYLNRSVVEENCPKAKPCYASDQVVPVCASDNKTYLNPGVLVCAQDCDSNLRVSDFGFGPCPHHDFPTTPETSFHSAINKSIPTTTPHPTSADRTKVYGSVRKFFEWLGFHIHDDGGLYIANEKENKVWWNI